MKFIVAPDSYKESASAVEVADAMEKGIRKVFPDAEIIKIPIADGGEGTIDTIHYSMGGVIKSLEVLQADGLPASAKYIIIDGKKAIIEVAQACGLEQIARKNRNPLVATSFGVGELIMDALKRGVNELVVCLGGSATNDGGAGMLQALGVKLRNKEQRELGLGNQSLGRLETVDISLIHAFFAGIKITIVTDVQNTLLGPQGATNAFGKQKGARYEDVDIMEKNMQHYADVMEKACMKTVRDIPGSGAAGGLGFALQLLAENVEVVSGINFILDAIHFDKKVQASDLVLTGEGGTDFQTAYGKAPIGVTKRAKSFAIPTIIISGRVDGDLQPLYDAGVVSVHSVLHTIMTLDDAMKDAVENIAYTTEAIMRTRFL